MLTRTADEHTATKPKQSINVTFAEEYASATKPTLVKKENKSSMYFG
jgi:hypothetical protein